MKKRLKTLLMFITSILVSLVYGVLFIVAGFNGTKLYQMNFMTIATIASGVGSLIFVGVASTLMWFYLKIHGRDEDEDDEAD